MRRNFSTDAKEAWQNLPREDGWCDRG